MINVTGERVGGVVRVRGDNFLFEQINEVSIFTFTGNIKGRRVIRENVKAIRGVLLNG